MSTTPDTTKPAPQAFTDAQLQAAIDAAFPVSYYSALIARNDDARWPEEASCRLTIAKAFLAELGKIKPATADNPYARLKAYAAAGARIRCATTGWQNDGKWGWCYPPNCYEVHPDDLHLVPEYAPKHPDAQENWNQYAEKQSTVWIDPVCGCTRSPDASGPCPECKPAWIPHDGGPCPLKDEEVEEWEWELKDKIRYKSTTWGNDWEPSYRRWKQDGVSTDIVAYRVLKWKPGCGPKTKTKPETFEAQGKTWFKHVPGDPCPCEEGDKIEILCSEAGAAKGFAHEFCWEETGERKYYWGVIIGWRYADERPEQIPIVSINTKDCNPMDKATAEDLGAMVKAAVATSQPWQPAPGDVVRLKSGGPEMTVLVVVDSSVSVIWAPNSEKIEAADIPTACLQPVTKDRG